MTQRSAHHGDVLAGLDGQRGERVSQVMESTLWQPEPSPAGKIGPDSSIRRYTSARSKDASANAAGASCHVMPSNRTDSSASARRGR